MNLQKLNPWNWFKHEDDGADQDAQIPVQREEAARSVNPPSHWQGDQHPVLQVHQQIDRMFDDVFNAFGMPSLRASSAQQSWPGTTLANAYRPHIDVSGDEKRYEITLDAPGLSEDDLSIEIKGDMLVIKGQKEEKSEQKKMQFYRVERSYGSFQRTLSLPADANTADIQAKLKDGVLTLAIPRNPTEPVDVQHVAISSQ